MLPDPACSASEVLPVMATAESVSTVPVESTFITRLASLADGIVNPLVVPSKRRNVFARMDRISLEPLEPLAVPEAVTSW